MNDSPVEQKRKLAAYSTVGLMFPVSIAVGLAIGYFLDRWFHTSPYLIIIFTLYGIAGGFVNLIRVTGPNKKKNDE
ncbi:MAG: AtpZ/AtpI family protein [Candidatus Aminicenantes bacterium]|nr:AtpZ/AtpI family protein [Candidatus Aminicenantes bacterium]